MYKKLYLFVWVLISYSLVSCNKEEPIPSYIHIPGFKVEAQPEFGTSSSKLTETWVYANGKLLGVFPIPGTIPILESGVTDIQIFAGIHENGILNRPTIFPFYESIKLTPTLSPGKTDTLPFLVTKYLSAEDIMLALHIDFEIGNLLSVDLDSDTTTVSTIIAEGFEGQGVRLYVEDTSSNLSVGNTQLFSIPANGSQVYLELDYHNDIPFSIWFRGLSNNQTIETQLISALKPKEAWNKIYIPLTAFVNANKWLTYQLVFNVGLTDEQSDAGKNGEVIIDNIKILRFK